MEMQVNAHLIRQERKRRAWSQEHLAQVAGLGLRTIQRIESSGMASNESIASLATVFEMTVVDFMAQPPKVAENTQVRLFRKSRLWLTLAMVFLVQLLSPAQLTVAIVGLWIWVAIEIADIYLTKKRNPKALEI